MKIAIGFNIVNRAWGGGNQFVKSLKEYLENKGHLVVHDLKSNDIDIILIIDPRSRIPNIPFSTGSILRYLLFKNNKAIIVHRINECDERKNTKTMNFKLRMANFCSDQTIVVSDWLKKLNLFDEKNKENILTIRNGSNASIFNSIGHKKWSKTNKLKFVTHHWSGNWMKGFDIYKKFDLMLEKKNWNEKFEFTYIGNIPKNFSFKHTKHIEPLYEKDLANELRKHHGYLSASQNEPGGNHQNEGALCGLPLLYRNSGCLPEYCDGYGIKFSKSNFENKLIEFFQNYSFFYDRIKLYPYTDKVTCKAYLNLFSNLLSNRSEIIKKRKILSSPFKFLINHFI